MMTREQGYGARYVMEKYFATHHLAPAVRIEISGNETLNKQSLPIQGVSFVTSHTIVQELLNKQLTMLDIQDTPVLRDWHVVTTNKRAASIEVDVFRQFVLVRVGKMMSNL